MIIKKNENDPWVIFKLKKQEYAVHSSLVYSINTLPKITPIPKMPTVFKGIFCELGESIPVIEPRLLFSMASLEQESIEFQEMLEQRKHDHVQWAETLVDCIENEKPFTLATDPHLCTFGVWYDHYEPESYEVGFQLKKISEPHRKLHETALEALACKQNCEECERKDCLKEILARAKNEYMPKVLFAIDHVKEAFKKSERHMLIILDNEKKKIGILVDEVIGVEELPINFDTKKIEQIYPSKYIKAIAKKESNDHLVLCLEEEAFFEMIDDPK